MDLYSIMLSLRDSCLKYTSYSQMQTPPPPLAPYSMLDNIENLVCAYNSGWIEKTTLNGGWGLNFSWYFIETCALMSKNYGVPTTLENDCSLDLYSIMLSLHEELLSFLANFSPKYSELRWGIRKFVVKFKGS